MPKNKINAIDNQIFDAYRQKKTIINKSIYNLNAEGYTVLDDKGKEVTIFKKS